MPRPAHLQPKPKTADDPVRTERGYRHRYGIYLPYPLPAWQLELLCWKHKAQTGLSPYQHLRRAIELVCPQSAWHPWREDRFRALCDDEYLYRLGDITIRNMSWVGVGAATKTYDAATFAFFYWLADPADSYVILTSTSKNKMKQRAWPVIQECFLAVRNLMEEEGAVGPHMLNSTMELQATKGDSKHAIFGQAIEEGEVSKAVNNLLGVHASQICLVIDEAAGTPEAIYQTIPNMLKGCREFIIINSNNGPLTHLDPFSKLCTPTRGWKSITIESDQWRTKPAPEYQLPWGLCMHFDGKKSPNVLAGRTIYPFLYTWENWARVKDNPDAQRTATFWSQDRGFWPPEGFVNTVLTEELIEVGDARGQIEFTGKTTPIGALDSGFGGDACTLRFGRMGPMAEGKTAVQIDERIEIPIMVDLVDEDGKKVPAEYQIAKRVKFEASKRNVEPYFFGVEASGTGRGAAAVLTQEWGPIIWVESGGKPSDLPASEEDERKSSEIYDRRITELWFSVQAFVRGRHLGGLTEDDVMQFCARTYDKPTKKYVLEKKEDFKPRFGRSPDDADSVAILVEVARTRGGMHTKGPRAERMENAWEEGRTETFHKMPEWIRKKIEACEEWGAPRSTPTPEPAADTAGDDDVPF